MGHESDCEEGNGRHGRNAVDAGPQCDLPVAATFVTTATGRIPATNVTVKRIVDTGTSTFNCGVQGVLAVLGCPSTG